MAIKNIAISNAQLRFRNFLGKEGKYNAKGKRNFCVLLDDKLANRMRDEGWNIKYLKPREEGDLPQAYIQVSVRFDYYPPTIFMISSAGRYRMGEDDMEILDWAEFDNVDLVIRPHNWNVNGQSGTKAYLKKMYCTLAEDEFDKKYGNIPMMGEMDIAGDRVDPSKADEDDEDVPF